jgi:hypothetical protein
MYKSKNHVYEDMNFKWVFIIDVIAALNSKILRLNEEINQGTMQRGIKRSFCQVISTSVKWLVLG